MTNPLPLETRFRILLLEDSDLDAELISEFARQVQPEPEIVRASDRDEYIHALETARYDVILSDYSLPGFDGLAALDIALKKAPETPFIFVSGVLGEEVAIDSFRTGATDYVLKQRLMRLPAAIERALGEAWEKAERRRAEEQLKLLVAELSHRVKNTLAMVMSLVRRTAKSSGNIDEYEEALVSRLQALSSAHALIFESNWGQTDLQQVLERTLLPFRRSGDRGFNASGPRVKLDPKAALTLSLIFHELATNASKYGSLSVDDGMVEASWEVVPEEGNSVAKFLWRESGGPPVTSPDKAGFGSTLITRSIEYELDGEAQIRYPEDGIVCEIQFVVDRRN